MLKVKVGDLAAHLGVHRNTIRNWIKAGRMEASDAPGKGIFLAQEEYLRLCRECGVEAEPPPGRSPRNGGRGGRAAALAVARELGPRSDLLRSGPRMADVCITCGSCASACPISGVDGLDPRKVVRMVVLGRESELIESQWPWKCTLCGKCEEACPMQVEITTLMRRVRGLRLRERVPSPMHEGVVMNLERGNNLGIPQEDLENLLADLSQELKEEWRADFRPVAVDKKGADLLVTINSKEPFAEPDDMVHWWKIFHAAGEDWTIPGRHWEGVNWAMFTGDDASMRTLVGRLVANMDRLECKTLLLPD